MSDHSPSSEKLPDEESELVSILRELSEGTKRHAMAELTQEQYDLYLDRIRSLAGDVAKREGVTAPESTLPVDELGSGASPPVLQDGVYYRRGSKWRNWGLSLQRRTLSKENSFRPRTVEGVQELVRQAVTEGKRVRCVGHGHSWTPVFFDEAATAITKVLFVGDLALKSGARIELVREADQTLPAQVKVAAGVTTGELATFFEANSAKVGHVGLPSDVILNTVRYGGVISMACHGTGIHSRTVPDFVVALTLVDSKGELQEYTAGSDVWNEVRASFGLMGVIVDITFELDGNLTDPYVQVEHSFPLVKDTIANAEALEKLVMGADGIELFWFPLNSANLADHHWLDAWKPQNDKMWVMRFKRVPLSEANVTQLFTYTDSPSPRERAETLLGDMLNKISQGTGSLWLQAFYGLFAMLALENENLCSWGWLQNGIKTLPAAIHYQRSIDDFRVFDFEVSFPVKDDFSNVFKAWSAAIDIAERYIRTKKRNPLNVALEMRFTLGSEVTMSPAYNTQDSSQLYCWIEVLCGAQTPIDVWINFVKDVFAEWKKELDPIPLKLHWAKWNDLAESGHTGPDVFSEQIKAVYEDQIATFKPKVLRMDPKGVFRNDWLTKLFDLEYQ